MSIKTVLITGCSTGIGRALANEFLQQGYKVYATERTELSKEKTGGFTGAYAISCSFIRR